MMPLGLLYVAADSTAAGIITAAATIVTAAGGFVVALGLLVPILRNTKSAIRRTDEVHTIVNQQRTDMQRYTAALIQALKLAGLDIPIDQSLPLPPDTAPAAPVDGSTWTLNREQPHP